MKNIILQSNGSKFLEYARIKVLLQQQQQALKILGGKQNIIVLADAIGMLYKQNSNIFKKVINNQNKNSNVQKPDAKEQVNQSKFNKLYKKLLFQTQNTQDQQDYDTDDEGQIFKIIVKSPKSLRITKEDGSQLNEEQLQQLSKALLNKDKNRKPLYRQLKDKQTLSIKKMNEAEEDEQFDKNDKKQQFENVIKNLQNEDINFNNIKTNGFTFNKDVVKEIIGLASKKLMTDLKQQTIKSFKTASSNKNFAKAVATILAVLIIGKADEIDAFGF